MKPHIFRIFNTASGKKIGTVLIYGDVTGAEQDVVILDSVNGQLVGAVCLNFQPGYDRKGQ